MLRRTLIAAVVPLVAFGLHAQTGTPAWKTWKLKSCSMNYPTEWAFDNSGIGGSAVLFSAPTDSTHSYRPHVDLKVIDVKDMGMDAYVERAEKEMRAEFNALQLLRSETVRTPHEEHTFDFSGQENGQDIRARRSVRIAGGKAYVLTYMATPDLFDEDLYLAEAMFNSFAFSK